MTPTRTDDEVRDTLADMAMKIAALAVAAIQSIDRKSGRYQPQQ